MSFTPDWTIPSGTHPKWGELDRIAITPDDGSTRIHADWRPFAPGTRSPSLDAEWAPAGDIDGIPADLENLIEVGAWKLIRVLPSMNLLPFAATDLTVSPDDRLLLATANEGFVLVCLTTGRLVDWMPGGFEPGYLADELGMTDAGDWVVFPQMPSMPGDLRLYRFADGPMAEPVVPAHLQVDEHVRQQTLQGFFQMPAARFGWDHVPSYASTVDDPRLLIIGRDQTVFGYRDSNWSCLLRPGQDPIAVDLEWAPDHACFDYECRQLAVSTPDCGVDLFRLTSDQATRRHRLPIARGGSRLAFHRNGRWLASVGSDRVARIWDTDTGECLAELNDLPVDGWAVAFLRFRPLLVISLDDGLLVLWNYETGETFPGTTGHLGKVRDAAFSADGRRLATGGRDGTARVIEVDTMTTVATFGGHSAQVSAVAMTADGATVCTCSTDRTVAVWDVDAAMCRHVLRGHERAVRGLACHRTQPVIASVDTDGVAIAWNLETGEEVTRIRTGKPTARTNTSPYRVAAVDDGFWVIVPGQKPAFCSLTGAGAVGQPPADERLVGFNDAFRTVADSPLHKQVSADGRRLAVTMTLGRVLIFERDAADTPERYSTDAKPGTKKPTKKKSAPKTKAKTKKKPTTRKKPAKKKSKKKKT